MKNLLFLLTNFILGALVLIFVLLINSNYVLATKSNIEKLEEKVIRSYSKKFCNAIGIGISVEGATRLTIEENKQAKFNPDLWFEIISSGEKNLEKVSNQDLDGKISNSKVMHIGDIKAFNQFKDI